MTRRSRGSGPFGGVWAKPAVWPGDGGWIYYATGSTSQTNVTEHRGLLRAYHAGVDAHGNPTLALAASSSDAWGFSSSAGVVTSDGLSSGTALLWGIWRPAAAARARSCAPTTRCRSAGKLRLRFSAPIGTRRSSPCPASATAASTSARATATCSASARRSTTRSSSRRSTFPATTIGASTQLTATLTARAQRHRHGLSSSDPAAFSPGTPGSTAARRTSQAGDELDVPVTFAPAAAGLVAGSLTVATSAGTVTLELSGVGRTAEPHLDASPPAVSWGPLGLGREATGTVTLGNDGAAPLTIQHVDLPGPPFSVEPIPPEAGDVIAGGAAITVAVTFAPDGASGAVGRRARARDDAAATTRSGSDGQSARRRRG